MSSRNADLFLFDVYIAIVKIQHYVSDFADAESLKNDCKTWDATIREFEIIGESTKNLIKLGILDETHRDIVDFRNVLIHAYFAIDEHEVWGIIQTFLEGFKQEISTIIHHYEPLQKKQLIHLLILENQHIGFLVQSLQELQNGK
ncbi:HepT-like ribonuclease domain-containing protein [Chrysiogenes arsenatis]|uniref:HepT-like ribonuclease domain-containing protein n=1 Tax=Chrysiogenes arsenatis TaxID=309797 RepID=UPI0004291D6C|nr:HepT-like ribonuclease domain-containing protein [Chrysiogenes arsenatis]